MRIPEGFGRLLSGIPISLLAVDEAHCVSEVRYDLFENLGI
jgi:superfamily II DNA helicase RecQ